MKYGAMLLCVAALAACDARPGGDDQYGGTNGTGTGGVKGSGLNGDASDPSSSAYFNQTIGDRVLFAVDQSTLTPAATQTLDGQANWLMQYSNYTVTIEGHADEQGTREYNLALGARRANAVRDYLVSRGVASNRIDIVTYGKERPLAICSTEECWSKNRRAVTLVAAGLSS
jgi:peptidoglycan-associated lipoprotein